jgi:D-alanyl-lipoteichoic acid acyltransferase DltB (MBOAT superfamily)
MSLTQTLVFALLAVLIGLLQQNRLGPGSSTRLTRAFGPGAGRAGLLLLLSALAVYWLAPALPVRHLDFWLPTATLTLTTLCWVLTAPSEMGSVQGNRGAALTLILVVMGLGATRFLAEPLIVASTPPRLVQIFAALILSCLFIFLAHRFWRPLWLTAMIALLIAILVVLKTPALSAAASGFLRALNGQSAALASPLDLRWLGFSYIAFRLIHTLRDRQAGRLPAVSLGEFVTYVVFFPSLTAGPIDRIERFIQDLRAPLALGQPEWLEAGTRFFVGMFKKYVIADSLALIALGATNALQVRSAGWAWVLLYAFSLQIYFDFSGYTDMILGIARPMGIRLPENFNAPYLKPNLTQFWNSWHMTLTQWFRAYYFNPLTRALRTAKRPLPSWAMIFIAQVSTMVLIGLWHGITWNFALWGLWQGLGLFAHNRWSELLKSRALRRSGPGPGDPSQGAPARGGKQAGRSRLLNWGGAFVTFNYVSLGWVFFALPTIDSARHFFSVLFGLV